MTTLQLIYDTCIKRGYYFYDKTGVQNLQQQRAEVVQKGPVTKLQEGRTYVLLPQSKKPTAITSVDQALESLVRQFKGYPPRVTFQGTRIPCLGITLEDKFEVKLHTPEGTFLSPEEAVLILSTLTPYQP